MKYTDNEIKKFVNATMQKIDDDSFTTTIVTKYLQSVREREILIIFNFKALIFWIISVLIGLGLFILSINQEYNFHKINEQQSLIILTVSLVGLFYKWIEEISRPNNTNTELLNYAK